MKAWTLDPGLWTLKSVSRFRDHVIDDGFEIVAGLFVDAQLAICAGAVFQDPSHHVHGILDPNSSSIVHPIEVFEEQFAFGDFAFLAEVDEHAEMVPVPRRAPLVFHQQGAAVDAPALILGVQAVELDHRRLDERRDRDCLLYAQRDVADPHFERVEHRVRPDVPPDLLGVVDRSSLDEQGKQSSRSRPRS